jgi:hypothetical protein
MRNSQRHGRYVLPRKGGAHLIRAGNDRLQGVLIGITPRRQILRGKHHPVITVLRRVEIPPPPEAITGHTPPIRRVRADGQIGRQIGRGKQTGVNRFRTSGEIILQYDIGEVVVGNQRQLDADLLTSGERGQRFAGGFGVGVQLAK